MATATLEIHGLVDRGFCADMYAWGDGRVLKLFHDWVERDRADHEFAVTQALHAAGLPVPAAYELVEIDGRWGIIFERVDGVSLLRYIQERPWALLSAIRQLAAIHAQIHRFPAPDWLPPLRERIDAAIDASDCPLAQKRAVRKRLAGLPDGDALCHGDFHPGNVILTAHGPVVVDWDSAGRGDPIGDVAYSALLMRIAYLPPWLPGYMHWFFDRLRTVILRVYVNHYLRLRAGTWRQVSAWVGPLEVARGAWRPPTART